MIAGWLVIIIILVFFVFASALLFGAPYVPTLRKERRDALELLKLKKGQRVLELGSGDGSFLIEAAATGLSATGYEINPLLVLVTKWRARKCEGTVKVVWGNFWKADFSGYDGIFVFQMDNSMKKMETKILKDTKGKGIRIVSHAFKIPGKKPITKLGALFLYEY
jgi:SAM-dependent methyltransferase